MFVGGRGAFVPCSWMIFFEKKNPRLFAVGKMFHGMSIPVCAIPRAGHAVRVRGAGLRAVFLGGDCARLGCDAVGAATLEGSRGLPHSCAGL